MYIKTFLCFAIIYMAGFQKSTAQTDDDLTPVPPEACVTEEDKLVYTKVDAMPQFNGGEEALFNYLSKNISYPEEAKKSGLNAKVFISFIIDEHGKINEPKVVRGAGFGFDEEALRAVKNMPDWIPGRHNDKCVKVQYTLPVNFNSK